MKLKVLFPFRDKDNFLKQYQVGDTIEVDDERGETLVSRNLAEKEVEQPEEDASTSDPRAKEDTDAETEEGMEATEEVEDTSDGEKVVKRRRKK